MIYAVNANPLTVNEKVQILDLLQTLGPYKQHNGVNEYPCTTSMIDRICTSLQYTVSSLSIYNRISLALSLSLIPLEPVNMLVDQCVADVSHIRFKAVCFQLLQETQYMSTLCDKGMHFMEPLDTHIGLFCRYLFGSHQQISMKTLQNVFIRASENIELSRYNTKKLDQHLCDKCDHDGWTHIELTSCGLYGANGPSLMRCIGKYNTNWSKNQSIFNVSNGVQEITISRSGYYRITAYGAGWEDLKTHGVGMFRIYSLD